ncbi:hypothetical protein E2C01_052539 [Portunus trituberculatus]|uniref:Uncharacterized protein n=1 Tax=Portunus trituberculatus TaxID=210409 RepID=A0A5B7GM27_PORTR|nr:hypothetical protein [Portunus trituberculatus]
MATELPPIDQLRNSLACSLKLRLALSLKMTAPAGFIYVFLSNECAPSQCVGLNKVAAQSQVSPPSVTISKPARTKSLSQHTSGSEATDASSLKARTAQSQTENKKKVLPCISSVPASSASLCLPFTLLPGSFEVILCIDNAETSGNQKRFA